MSESTHEPINILKALEDDAPAIMRELESNMNKLCEKLADLAREHSHYLVLNMVKRELDKLPDD
jgi:hypothetical protein